MTTDHLPLLPMPRRAPWPWLHCPARCPEHPRRKSVGEFLSGAKRLPGPRHIFNPAIEQCERLRGHAGPHVETMPLRRIVWTLTRRDFR